MKDGSSFKTLSQEETYLALLSLIRLSNPIVLEIKAADNSATSSSFAYFLSPKEPLRSRLRRPFGPVE